MHLPINPAGMAAPTSHYNHAFYIEPGSAWMTLSGQLGERADGSCPESVIEQSELAWQNVLTILAEKGLGITNVAKVTSYVVDEENIDSYVQVHKRVVGEHMPPWTLVIVPALGRPLYKVEVDVTAAGIVGIETAVR
ncbi:Rid family hydrolase [Yoonia sp. F2084L]|uniref:RidA family protein n=1 Tax=Yoonia sp. F2084L TaxID=2926419 RepID=UPI001FF25AED|nr:Rid family hydrolase [Yoonia sp. F2084L]MCK0097731.1 Rid family hydrolase [Yoonia sp. F2084L]